MRLCQLLKSLDKNTTTLLLKSILGNYYPMMLTQAIMLQVWKLSFTTKSHRIFISPLL